MRQAQGTYYGQAGGSPGGTTAPGAGGAGYDPYPGITAAQGAGSPSGGITAGALLTGGLGSHLFGENNSTALQDIARAQAQGLPISDASWAQAGYGPGGSALNGGASPTAGATGAPMPGGAPGAPGSNFLSPTTNEALGLISDRARAGSPLLQTAQNTVQQFAGGNATQNPYLDAMFNKGADKIRDYTNAQFTMAGRGNSTANQDILGRNIGQFATDFYGGQYNNDQNRQLAAAQLAPGLANTDFTNLQQLLGAGQMYDQAPWQALQNYSGLVTGIGGLGGTKSQTAPNQSLLPQLLGTAATALPFLL